MDGIDWTQIPSDVAVIGAFIWGITHGLPKLIDSFKEELNRQRSDFRAELNIYRERHDQREERNNASVISLSESVNKVADKVDLMHQTINKQHAQQARGN